MKRRFLTDKEKQLLFKLYCIGMEQPVLAELFTQSEINVYKIYLKFTREGRKKDFTLAEKSKILTELLLYNLTKNIHLTTIDQKMKILPELLKIKEEQTDEDSNIAQLYIPAKVKTESDQDQTQKTQAEQPPA